MTGPVDERLSQQLLVACGADDARIRLLVLLEHQPVAGRVHGQHRLVDPAMKMMKLLR